MASIFQKKKRPAKPKLIQRLARQWRLRKQFKVMNELLKLKREENRGLHIFPSIRKISLACQTVSFKPIAPNKMERQLLETLEQQRTLERMALCNKGFVFAEECWQLIIGPDGNPAYYLVDFGKLKKEKPRKI